MSERMVELPVDALIEGDFETIHLYPKDRRYRRSGNRACPQPGDIARCGWVKQKPGQLAKGSANCLMCIRLKELSKP